MNKKALLIFVLVNNLCLSLFIWGQNRTYYDNLKKSKKSNIAYSKQMLSSIKSNNKNQLDKLLLVREQIHKQKEVLYIITKEINLLDEEIAFDEKQLGELNSKLENLKAEYAKLIYYASLNSNVQRRMIFILSAESFNNAYKRILYLKHLSDYRKNRGEDIKNSIHKLDSAVTNLKNLKIVKTSLNLEKTSELDSLNSIRKELDRIVANSNLQIADLKSQINKEEKKKVVIKQSVTSQISKVEENKEVSESKKSHKLEGDISDKFLSRKRRHIWPLEKCVVLQHYGDYYHPKYENIVIKNDGIELGSSPGKSVYAIFEGKIISVIPIPGDGYSLIVEHGEYYSVYSKVDKVTVKGGDIISTGQIIGKLSKNAEICKLIFQLWHKKEKLNPELWLKKR